MNAEVKILVEYNPKDDTVFLSSRGVEGDGLPLNVYIGMLQALCQMQKQYNNRLLEITMTIPSEISIASDAPAALPHIEVAGDSKDDNALPPPKTVVSAPSKRPKRYTVEEKTEIAMLYASGHNITSIAEKFGRKPQAIRILMNKMGVKRGSDIEDPGSEDKTQPKRGSALKKPWYLKK